MIVRYVAMLLAICGAIGSSVAADIVTGITARQRYPWNGKVDIVVTMQGDADTIAQTECAFAATNKATQTAVNIVNINKVGEDVLVGDVCTRRYVWNATADVGEVKIDKLALTVDAITALGGVQLWAGGPYWADYNVGATAPGEYGYYFWWGDTVGYKRDGGTWTGGSHYSGVTWVSSKGERMSSSPFYSQICPTYGKSSAELQAEGYIDSTGNLTADCDAATKHWGAPWRMPTDADLRALLNKCNVTWTKREGVYGRVVTGKGDYSTKSVFFPATGYAYGTNLNEPGLGGDFWSSSPDSPSTGFWDDAWAFRFNSRYFGRYYSGRFYGKTVRPLRGFGQRENVFVFGTATVQLSLDTLPMPRTAVATEMICFSPMWETNGVSAEVSLNGAVVTNATEAGAFNWMLPAKAGTYRFTHTTRDVTGVTVATETASFVVQGPDMPVFSPASGAIFKDYQKILITAAADTSVYYTTNGVEPTTSSTQGVKFYVYGKCTVKAIAVKDGMASETAIAEYAKGTCETPTIEPPDGTAFSCDGQRVVLSWNTDEGELRYTLDGSEPTTESPLYKGSFTIDDTTTIKAKVFGVDYFDSAVMTATLTREWQTATTPAITAVSTLYKPVGDVFTGSWAKVSIVCLTDGATIHFTTNGVEPTLESEIYAAPFFVRDNCTIKAFAVREDGTVSSVATRNLTRAVTYGDALGLPDHAFTSAGDAPFEYDAVNGALRSGAIGNEETSSLCTTFEGEGTLTFTWKTSCEEDPEHHDFDHAECWIDGEQVGFLEGITDWVEITREITGEKTHKIEWRYVKDALGGAGEDCMWVKEVVWTSANPVATVGGVPVPYEWLKAKLPETPNEQACYDAAAKRTAANPAYTFADCYVAGLEPTNAASVFAANAAITNGIVYVSWTPNLNDGDLSRIYTLVGRTDLDEGEWEAFQPWHRFFKVAVSLPTGAAGETSAVSGEGFAIEEKPLGGVQLWENGPYWAECNVGATAPEEYGYYFWWGDTVGYKRTANDDGWISVKGEAAFSFGKSNCPTYGKDNATLEAEGYIDATGNLAPDHDAATKYCGAPWRMPTDADFQALTNNCDTTWITREGIYGRLVTGRGDYSTKSIFFPAPGYAYGSKHTYPGSYGYYWSSTPNSTPSFDGLYEDAFHLLIRSSSFNYDYDFRYYGRSVRPVRDVACP